LANVERQIGQRKWIWKFSRVARISNAVVDGDGGVDIGRYTRKGGMVGRRREKRRANFVFFSE